MMTTTTADRPTTYTEQNPLFDKMSARFMFDGKRTVADMMRQKAARSDDDAIVVGRLKKHGKSPFSASFMRRAAVFCSAVLMTGILVFSAIIGIRNGKEKDALPKTMTDESEAAQYQQPAQSESDYTAFESFQTNLRGN